MGKTTLLSFDVEEFDLPLEYGCSIEVEEQLSVAHEGAKIVSEILTACSVPTTLFTTAHYASNFPIEVRRYAELGHEIGSHSYYHTEFCEGDLLRSRLELERISGVKVTGFRAPRFRQFGLENIKAAGFLYDSSVQPTWIPGRYNNLSLPRLTYQEKDITRVPVSVTPKFRIPLFWLLFKNAPYRLYYKLAMDTLKKDGVLSLYFHPWEFSDLSRYKIPSAVKRNKGLDEKLYRLIADLKQHSQFSTIKDFLS